MIKSVFTNSKKKKLNTREGSKKNKTIKNSRSLTKKNSFTISRQPIIINHYIDNLDTILENTPTQKIIGFMKKMVVQDNMLTGLLMMIQKIPTSNNKTREEMEIIGYRDTLYKNVMKMKKYLSYQMILQSNIAILHTHMSTLVKLLKKEMNRVHQSGGVNVIELIMNIMGASLLISALINAESDITISAGLELRTNSGAYDNYKKMDNLLDGLVIYGHKFINAEANTMPHLHELCDVNGDPTCMEKVTQGYSLTREYKPYHRPLSTPLSQFSEFGKIGRWRGQHVKIITKLMNQFNSYSSELNGMLYAGCLKLVDTIQSEPPELVIWNLQEAYDNLQRISEQIAKENIDNYNLNVKKEQALKYAKEKKEKEEREKQEMRDREKSKREEEKRRKEEEREEEHRQEMHRVRMNMLKPQKSEGLLSSFFVTPSKKLIEEEEVVDYSKFFPHLNSKVPIHPRKKAHTKRGVLLLNVSSQSTANKVEENVKAVSTAFENQVSEEQMKEISYALAQVGIFEKEQAPMNIKNVVEVYKISRAQEKKSTKAQIKQGSKNYFNNLCKASFEKPIRASYNETTEMIQLDMDTNWYMLRVIMANLMNTVEESHSKYIGMPISELKNSRESRIKSLYELSKLYVKILDDFEFGLITVYNGVPKNSVEELYAQTTEVFASTNAMVKHQIVSENASRYPYTVKNEIEMSMLKSIQKEKWRDQWSEFLESTQETVNNTIAISSAFLSPVKDWTKNALEGISEIEKSAVSSIIMNPIQHMMDESFNMSMSALASVSVLSVAFMMIMTMCYYKFAGRIIFGSIGKKKKQQVPQIESLEIPPQPQPQPPSQPQSQPQPPAEPQIPAQPTFTPTPPPPPQLPQNLQPGQPFPLPPLPYQPPPPGTPQQYAQQHYAQYLQQVYQYQQMLQAYEYQQYLMQQQYPQQMSHSYMPQDDDYEYEGRELTGRQLRRSRRGDLRRQRRQQENL